MNNYNPQSQNLQTFTYPYFKGVAPLKKPVKPFSVLPNQQGVSINKAVLPKTIAPPIKTPPTVPELTSTLVIA